MFLFIQIALLTLEQLILYWLAAVSVKRKKDHFNICWLTANTYYAAQAIYNTLAFLGPLLSGLQHQ